MDDDRKTGGLEAISLRDHFAGLAMAQILVGTHLLLQRARDTGFVAIAKTAYELADAMVGCARRSQPVIAVDDDLRTLFAQICAGAGVCMGGIYEDVAVELAKIARAGEREACARVCEDVDATHGECPELARYCAAEIRLRSKS